MTFLNEVTMRYPEAVSFAPGRPYEEFFETKDIFSYLRRYLDYLSDRGVTEAGIRTLLFQYGATAGQIRDIVAESLRIDEGITVSPESIVITVGCQEAPAYVGITGAACLLDITVAGVAEDVEHGLSCAALEEAVQRERRYGRRPQALYIVPDHSNPSGNTISLAVRNELLDLASRLDFLILEDSPYRGVSLGEQLPTLKALDRDCRVLYLGSYAKTAFPGARIGFVVADQAVSDTSGSVSLLADELSKIKSMITVNTPSLSQAVVAGMLLTKGGGLLRTNERMSRHYDQSLQAMLASLARSFPAERLAEHGVRWNAPTGGFFLTVRVPFTASEPALNRSAKEFGVIWTPMSYFHPDGGGSDTMRLSFSLLSPEAIEAGIERLAAFIESEKARPG
jgi:(S)-3,5-dihydroxyphenylglycine transaminase